MDEHFKKRTEEAVRKEWRETIGYLAVLVVGLAVAGAGIFYAGCRTGINYAERDSERNLTHYSER